ncbi:hypothetical protein [Dysgonomonas capnocytophagoides]|uniref:hypothetical protein n=1 Tax=Dysgonomonas capnocytophagoides TaxID=45254 RepID=UPI00399176B8
MKDPKIIQNKAKTREDSLYKKNPKLDKQYDLAFKKEKKRDTRVIDFSGNPYSDNNF